MTRQRKRYEVRSYGPHGPDDVVFSADAVDEEARVRRTTAKKAADRLAREIDDPFADDTVYVAEVAA